jgi:transcriptional repressor NrdR
MKCPFCGGEEDRVIDSRSVREGSAIRRRRECTTCNQRYTTYEYIEDAAVTVIKSNHTREPYDRQKLTRGIMLAATKRPVTLEQIEAITSHVEDVLGSQASREVESSAIGELVMEQLKKIDEVAYIRFASVYRRFQSVNEFTSALKDL